MDDESKKFNKQMFQEWIRQRANWRPRLDIGEDPLLVECEGQVLSPRNDTMEGMEKLWRWENFRWLETDEGEVGDGQEPEEDMGVDED